LKQVSHGLLGLVQNYNSGSESENDDDTPSTNGTATQQLLQFDGVHPPDYLKNVIDKTAGYVAKNGKDFEEILRTKRADFEFLNVTDEFHPYYLFKVQQAINPYVVAPAKVTSVVSATPVAKPPLIASVPPSPLIGGKLSGLEKRKLPPPGLVKPKIMGECKSKLFYSIILTNSTRSCANRHQGTVSSWS
jgi:Surp module